MQKVKFDSRAFVPIATAILSLVFIGVGLNKFGFWDGQPTPAFFPTIIAVVLFATSLMCLVQELRSNQASPSYNKNELLVILGAGGVIVGCWVIGLIPSCLLYLLLWLKAVERTPWKVVILIEVFMAVLIIGVFVIWMQVQFPMGLFDYIMLGCWTTLDNFVSLMAGLNVLFSPENLGACALGAVLGLIVGAMPGLGSLAGVALLLPLTYKFNPTTAIIMLGALYYSNMYGGAFSAILLNIPGDSPAITTALDGYPMAKKGRPGQALMTANLASFIGGTIGIIILTLTASGLAKLGLNFGYAEMTLVLLIAMTSISWLIGENPIKGIVITMLGILVASIGMDTLSGMPRFNFDNMYLMGGITFTPFIIGAVGFAQVIKLINERKTDEEKRKNGDYKAIKLSIRGAMPTKHDIKRLLPPAIRSSILGTFVGVLPGSGATTGSMVGYAMQKKFKSEEPMGTGAIEGIAASEAGNNSAAAGAFAPLLALGIPGSGTGAVLLGGLMMWGLNPGPLLFETNPDFCWSLISSLYLANVLTLAVAVLVIPFLIKILSVPIKYMIPIITCICIVGAYSTSYSMYGVIIMFVSGIVGYLLDKNGFPTAPMLLAFVLAPMLEENMRKAFIASQGSLSVFANTPLKIVLLVIFLVLVLTPVVKAILHKVKTKSSAAV